MLVWLIVAVLLLSFSGAHTMCCGSLVVQIQGLESCCVSDGLDISCHARGGGRGVTHSGTFI